MPDQTGRRTSGPTIAVPLQIVRDLLTGVLAEPCFYLPTGMGEGRRACVTHRTVQPCAVYELRLLMKEDEEFVADLLRYEREAWLESPAADSTIDPPRGAPDADA